MKEQEAIKELNAIIKEHETDNEALHVNADQLLLEFLAANGFTSMVHAYESIQDEFWCA